MYANITYYLIVINNKTNKISWYDDKGIFKIQWNDDVGVRKGLKGKRDGN